MHTHTKAFLYLLILALSCTACEIPGYAVAPVAAVSQVAAPIGTLLVAAPPGSTATPTPFQPVPPTAVYYPTDIPTPIPPTPTATPPPTPVEVPQIPEPQGLVQILLLGSDQRPGDFAFRTDSIMLVTLNPSDGYMSLTSIPRDLYVDIPGWGTDRINTAWEHGGFGMLASTLKYNFGVRPQHYVLIDFHSFNRFIDSLGGIDVNAAVRFVDRRPGFGNVTIKEGINHMDGKTALWYARSRKSTSDFSRSRRQHEVLLAIADKLISVNAVTRLPEFYEIYKNSITTDLSLTDMLSFLPLAAKVSSDRSRIRDYFIGPQEVWDWITPGGAMVLLPRQDAIQQLLHRAMKGQ